MWYTPRFPGRILFSLSDHDPTGSRRSTHRRRSAVFRLERLEKRTVLSTLTVLNNLDSGPGSLRDTIAAADNGDTIDFAKSVHKITLTSGELAITKSLDIKGPGPNKLKISGNDANRVFDISAGETVTLAGLTITDGLANGSAPVPSSGGGILNSGNLTLINDVLSDNQAVGDANQFAGGFRGEARGGAIGTSGTLKVTGCQFINNQALGASGSSGTAAAGAAVGGAIDIFGTALTVSIDDSQFAGNVARGGNGGNSGTDSLAGLGNGGAIFNGSNLTVTDSTFRHNQAIGGNDNNGSRLIGLGTGGAIGNGGPTATHVVLDVSGSTFDHNQAIGGNDNQGIPNPLFGPNAAGGGAIQIVQGSGNKIRNSTFDHNQAIGGQGAPGSDGGFGVGGGIFVFALQPSQPPSPVDVTVTDCAVDHNDAIGGPGGSGGNGGDGSGGGIASLGLSTTLAATLTVTDTTVDHNMARGGPGGAGGNGGNGYGGGLYNGAFSKLSLLTGVAVEHNKALGGEGDDGGSDGAGIGGGVYNLGVFAFDPTTVIKKNHASTSNDDIFP